MRAGTLNVIVETGAWWSRVIQLVQPAAPVAASTATAGQRYYVDGWPLRLYANEAASGGQVRLRFGHGVYSDVSLTVDADAGISPAVPLAVVDAAASYLLEAVDPVTGIPVPLPVDIPCTIAADGSSLRLDLDATTTAAMAPLAGGAYSWDLYLRTVAWDWERIVEGTFTIVKGDAR